MTDKLVEIVEREADEIGQRAKASWRTHYDLVAAQCESPIERMMLAALWGEALRQEVSGTADTDDIYVWPEPKPDMKKWEASTVREPHLRGFHMRCQVEIGRYRVDFLLHWFDPTDGVDLRVVVECDGHDFHERTKEQAARDKSRDRSLQAAGFRVMRFTGSEIYRDHQKCAEQVIRMLIRDVWRARGIEVS